VRAAAEFDFARYAERLLQEALPGLARISAVVPNYNHARHLEERLASVFAQTHPVAEVILLDDASTDASLAVAQHVAEGWGRAIDVVANPRNGGCVFAQWRRGVERARGDWVWIAESDDAAEPGLLAALAPRTGAAADVVAVACDSRAVDAGGALLWESHQAYYAASGASALARDGVFTARDFAARFLAERNLWVNASAILFRRAALLAALERCAAALPGYRMAGDWHLYLDLLGHSAGHVAWVAAPLNRHRRHAASVTGALEPERHLDEIARAQAHARAVLGEGPGGADAARQAAYRDEVAAQLLPARRRRRR
jgi:glycosyltransferase involved in cell wall biosynthesis